MIYEAVLIALIFIIFYSYAGYGILLILIVRLPLLAKLFPKPRNKVESKNIFPDASEYCPKVTLIISASGESRELIRQKIENTVNLDYPKDKLEVFFAIAYDPSQETDPTLDAYYDEFLAEPSPQKISSTDEEVYIKFFNFDQESDLRSGEVLSKLEEQLEKTRFDSAQLTPGAKELIESNLGAGQIDNEMQVYITKDIRRKGKIAQVNRTVEKAGGEIIVFSDANSFFNRESIRNIVRHFNDMQVGCVAGEKRVKKSESSTSGEGEGLYWKYESLLKKFDSRLWTTVGAAGEIFAVRKELWAGAIEQNAIIEDFVVSMRIAEKGYRVIYEPEAYAEEEPTHDLQSELIRRKRIAAGGFQSIVWLKSLLNPFKYGVLTFQYISHRVLRWAVVPFLLPVVFILNLYLVFANEAAWVTGLFALQCLFYFLALTGWRLELKRKKIKIFYFPFLLVLMNYAAYHGFFRYLKGSQSVVWERVKR